MADMTFPQGFINESQLRQAELCRNMWRSAYSLEWVNQRPVYIDNEWPVMRQLWNSWYFLELSLTHLLGCLYQVRVVTMATINVEMILKEDNYDLLHFLLFCSIIQNLPSAESQLLSLKVPFCHPFFRSLRSVTHGSHTTHQPTALPPYLLHI